MAEPTWFEETTFYVFVITAFYYSLMGFLHPTRFITFPVISAVVWLTYLAPQAFGILYTPKFLPAEVYYHGFGQSMIMATLCLVLGTIGWRVGLSRPVVGVRQENDIRPQALLIWGVVFMILGWTSFLYVTQQSGGIVAHYSVDGNYQLDWLGDEVIASFFEKISFNISIVLLMFLRPKILGFLVLILAILPTVGDIVLLNRRSDVVYLIIAVAVPLFLVRNWVPSRATMLVMAVIGLFVVFTFPVIRGTFLIGSQQSVDIAEAFRTALFESVLGGEVQKEFNNSVGVIASVDRLADFGYGRNMWNLWVQTTVPRSILGPEIKQFLTFENVGFAETGMKAYRWAPQWFQSYSSAAMLFYDFWYFGALIFFFIGHYFGKYYLRIKLGSLSAKITYVAILLLVPHWISVGFAKAPRDIALTLLMFALMRLADGRRRRERLRYNKSPRSI
jgi:hypothetical protein